MKYFVIEDATQTIINAILVDPQNLPDVGDGYSLSATGGNIGDVLVNGEWVTPQPDPTEALAAERATMVCSPMQGILTLGETEWAKVLEYRDTTATWQEKVIIDSALDWKRNSQNIAFFQYLLGYTDEQVDNLFRTAIQVEA